MKITLVQPPLLERGREDLTAPLGLLTLGAVLRDESVDVEIIDFNLKGFQDPQFLDPATFYQAATAQIASTNPDVVGFTSMGLESHVCLGLAQQLKQRDPALTTLFGGPHFGSIASQVLETYPWADYIVTGAAERPVIDFVHHLRDHAPAPLINIAHRTHTGVTLDRRISGNIALDDLPFPAHDLIDVNEYFSINPLRMLCLEHARGCQLRCSFCYSETHWGHGETLKRTERVIAELEALNRLGAGLAFLVADNFVTSKKAAIELCGAIAEADLPIRLKCYATLAQLTTPVVEAMEAAKCVAVFVGVDAVSAVNQRDLKKTYFKGWNRLRGTLELCMKHGVQPTCSFMLTPADTLEGTERTLRTALFTKAIGAYICVNALSIYNETTVDQRRPQSSVEYGEHKPALLFDTPPLNVCNQYARQYPELFPMHQRSRRPHTDQDLSVFCHVAYSLMLSFPKTLLRYTTDNDGALVELVDRVAQRLAPWFEKGLPLTSDLVSGHAVEALRGAIAHAQTAPPVLEVEVLERSSSEVTEAFPAELNVGGMKIPCRIFRYLILEFSFDPHRSGQLERSTVGIDNTSYVVTARNGIPRFLTLDDRLRSVLGSLALSGAGRAVPVDFDMYQKMKNQLLLAPVLGNPRVLPARSVSVSIATKNLERVGGPHENPV